jgi:lipopolysaccharide biosynthesis glycosyltransferase
MTYQEKIRIAVGYDPKESIAYHTFCNSLICNSSSPLEILPLHLPNLKNYKENHSDGSNNFIYTRFLVPYLCNFDGWCIYADGDMICNEDIAKLWRLKNNQKAIQVVKHDYKTKQNIKYFGKLNENYPKKNWSSLILWNCSHIANKVLSPEFVSKMDGKFLHRFEWLKSEEIGDIPKEWNWLAIEYEDNYDAKIIHYTLGTPCLLEYRKTSMSDIWMKEFKKTLTGFE